MRHLPSWVQRRIVRLRHRWPLVFVAWVYLMVAAFVGLSAAFEGCLDCQPSVAALALFAFFWWPLYLTHWGLCLAPFWWGLMGYGVVRGLERAWMWVMEDR